MSKMKNRRDREHHVGEVARRYLSPEERDWFRRYKFRQKVWGVVKGIGIVLGTLLSVLGAIAAIFSLFN